MATVSKLDGYLRSIEKFGATGAVLASGQAVTLRFPAGDRQAQQVMAHDQIVALVREVAPPAVFAQLEQNRAAGFGVEGWHLSVQPRPGLWQVAIEPARTSSPAIDVAPAAEMQIERGAYDGASADVAATDSGSGLLDGLVAAARAAGATDIYLAAGAPAFQRIGGALRGTHERAALDAETISRELGLVAPADARAAWSERGGAVFAYGDAAGRVRVTLSRDRRGPGAALRLLPGEAPSLSAIGLGDAAAWLEQRGLVVVAGPAGSGKTTVLAALVRALGEARRRVVTIEDPIEILSASPGVSQRAVGEHVATAAGAVAAALSEAADAIAIGAVRTADDGQAVADAVAGGALVLTTVGAPVGAGALDALLHRVPADLRAACRQALVGMIAPGPDGAFTVIH